jgi:glucosyl-3-phosphoglycerate phosphatase
MHLYFVRHGETDLNKRFVHQSPSTPLNAKGFEQARTTGEALRPMNATLLISSTYVRAKETARMIGQCVGLTPQYLSLFREVGRPSGFAEASLYSIRSLWFLFLSVLFRNRQTWRYDDAENFSDIYARVQESFHFIEKQVEAHDAIIIVSHAAYINLMLSYMCHGQVLTLRELVRTLLHINELKNGDIIHVEYVGPTPKGTCAWLLRK